MADPKRGRFRRNRAVTTALSPSRAPQTESGHRQADPAGAVRLETTPMRQQSHILGEQSEQQLRQEVGGARGRHARGAHPVGEGGKSARGLLGNLLDADVGSERLGNGDEGSQDAQRLGDGASQPSAMPDWRRGARSGAQVAFGRHVARRTIVGRNPAGGSTGPIHDTGAAEGRESPARAAALRGTFAPSSEFGSGAPRAATSWGRSAGA